jgi:thiol-disulfide isomerase/thioredoxin
MQIKGIGPKNFQAMLQASHTFPVVVIVVSDGCPYCEAAKPRFLAFAQQWPQGRVGFIKDDVFPDLIKRYKIEAFPSYVLFRGGNPVRKTEGMLDPKGLAAFVSA